MTFEIEVGGRLQVVSVEPLDAANRHGGRFRLVVRGEADTASGTEPVVTTFDIEARATDLGISLVYADGHRSVDAACTDRVGGECLVQLPHVDLVAAVDRRRLGRAGDAEAGGSGEQKLNAPMPGRIVRVLVKPGDDVVARQGLIVMEAMKMENELVALRAGRVTEIAVTEGATVEAGRLLLRIS
jgi:biotin carboxyl carrier protein